MAAKERHKIVHGSCLVLLRNQGQEVLLQQHAATSYHPLHYGLISGHVEAGEFFTEAMAREALEEAGITVKPSDLSFVHCVHEKRESKKDELLCLFFAAETWQGEPKICEPTKCIDLRWFPIDQLPENTIPFMRYALEQIIQRKIYSEIPKQ